MYIEPNIEIWVFCLFVFVDFDKSQRKSDTECSFIQENSISCESGQADISSKIPNKTGYLVEGEMGRCYLTYVVIIMHNITVLQVLETIIFNI